MIKFLLLIILVEAVTEIVVASAIMAKPREFIAKHSAFLGELIHCGYCSSVWISASIVWVVPLAICSYFWVNYAFTVFIVHRLSNLFHELISKWLGRRPVTFAVHKTESVLMQTYTQEADDDQTG